MDLQSGVDARLLLGKHREGGAVEAFAQSGAVIHIEYERHGVWIHARGESRKGICETRGFVIRRSLRS